MKLLLALLLLGAFANAEDEQKCEEGKTWMMDCNQCSCMNGRPACTEMACLPRVHDHHRRHISELRLKRDTGDLIVKDNSYKKQCRTGDEWRDQDCNRCHCEDDHKAVCTKRKCSDGKKLEPTPGWENIFNINNNRRKRSQVLFNARLRLIRDTGDLIVKHNSYKQQCKPGDVWKDQDCNRCDCGDNNIAVCTKRVCRDGQKLEPTPGWENIFNINNNRRKRAEEPHNEQLRSRRSEEDLVVKDNAYKQQCKPGDEWKDQDCNGCYCGDDNIAVCTKRRCPGGQKLEPTPGWENIFKINNNRRKRSVIKPDSYSDNCVLGDRWGDQDCNECVCGDIGAICSRRLCADGKRLEPTPGWEEIFNIDKSLTNDQHRRKRSNDLVVKPNSYKEDCKLGDVWKDEDCNRCDCGDDNIAVCTKRRCPGGQKLEPTSGWENIFNTNNKRKRRSESRSDVVKPDSYLANCVFGDRWMDQDCNHCSCDKFGAFCTTRLCGGERLEPTPGWENMFNIENPSTDSNIQIGQTVN